MYTDGTSAPMCVNILQCSESSSSSVFPGTHPHHWVTPDYVYANILLASSLQFADAVAQRNTPTGYDDTLTLVSVAGAGELSQFKASKAAQRVAGQISLCS